MEPDNEAVVQMVQLAPVEDREETYSTGFDNIDITVINMPTHTDSTVITHQLTMPTKRTGFDDAADLISATPAKHYKLAANENRMMADVVLDLVCQQRTYIRAAIKGSWPDMSSSTSYLTALKKEMAEGLMWKPPQKLQDDGVTASTTIAQYVAGFDWKQAGTPAYEGHFGWLRRSFYTLGLLWAPSFPPFSARLTEQRLVQIERMFYIYTCAAVKIVADLLIALLPIQSDKAMFNIALKIANLVNKKVDPTMGSNIEPIWSKFAELNKVLVTSDAIENEKVWVSDYIDVSLINGTTLEDSIHEYKTEFMVSNIALKLAREMAGIGKYEKCGATDHFLILWNNACYTKTGTPCTGGPLAIATSHGAGKWTLGLETYCALKYLEDCRQMDEEWVKFIAKSVHWTYKDISVWGAGLYTSFSMFKSVMGLADPTSYRGLRALFNWGTRGETSGWDIAPDTWAPSDILSGGAIVRGSPYWHAADWIYPFLQYGDLKENDIIYFPVGWTMPEFINRCRWGMLLATNGDITDYHRTTERQLKYTAQHLRLVTLVNNKNREIVCLMHTPGGEDKDVETLRFEHVLSATDFTNYFMVANKFIACLDYVDHSMHLHYQAPRPKIEDGWPSQIVKIGNRDVQKKFLQLYIGATASLKGTDAKPAALAAPSKEPVKVHDPPALPTVPPQPTSSTKEEDDEDAGQ